MQLSITKARQCLIHGTSDDVVPAAFSRDYVNIKRKRTGETREEARLLEITAADHFDLIDPGSKAWKEIEKTVLELTV